MSAHAFSEPSPVEPSKGAAFPLGSGMPLGAGDLREVKGAVSLVSSVRS
jgi:hypothetical protein